MMNNLKFINDEGPQGVFIFYGYLLLDEKFKDVVVFDTQSLRSMFVQEYKKTKNDFNYLSREFFKEAFGADLIKSYLYIKDKYFNESIVMKIEETK